MKLSKDLERKPRGVLTICMTGACPSYTRDSLWAASEAAGFIVKKNMSSLVDVLVAAEPTSQSGKAIKARQLGAPIHSYEWLMRRLSDSGAAEILQPEPLLIQ